MTFIRYAQIDIKFIVHDMFLEWPSSGTLKIEKIRKPKKSKQTSSLSHLM